jgi:hypothetical protein
MDRHYAVMADGKLGMSSITYLTLESATRLAKIWRQRMPSTKAVYVVDMNTMEKNTMEGE